MIKKKMFKSKILSSCTFYQTFNGKNKNNNDRKFEYISFVIVLRKNRDQNWINRPALVRAALREHKSLKKSLGRRFY